MTDTRAHIRSQAKPPRAQRDMRIHLPAHALRVMHDDVCRGYPEEVCGILVGVDRDGDREILEAVPVENARTDERNRRYVIDAETLRRVERDAERDGNAVIGFYHSHPDHSAVPSDFDREHSWPWYTYVIIAVRNGAIENTRAWRLTDDRIRFDEAMIDFGRNASMHQTRNQSQKPAPETGPP